MGKAGAVILSSVWLAACVTAWNHSTSSGGNQKEVVDTIVREVGQSAKLSAGCKILASELAEAAIKAKTIRNRTRNARMREQEKRAIDMWEASKCPVRALPGISFGVAEAVREDHQDRYGFGG